MIQIPTDEEISWFIGIHEGDGHFGINKSGIYKYLRFILEMRDQDTVHRVYQMWGTGGVSIIPPRNKRTNTKYRWEAQAQKDVLEICELIFSHLTMIRKTQMGLKLLETNHFVPRSTPVKLHKLAWLAGILEAEGSFGLLKCQNRYNPVVQIQMGDRPTLEYIAKLYQELFNIEFKVLGPYYKKDYISKYEDGHDIKAENCQPMYALTTGARDKCVSIASAVYPYMSARKQQCIDDMLQGINRCRI